MDVKEIVASIAVAHETEELPWAAVEDGDGCVPAAGRNEGAVMPRDGVVRR